MPSPLWTSSERTSAAVSEGSSDHSRAAEPVAIGAAAEVSPKGPYPSTQAA